MDNHAFKKYSSEVKDIINQMLMKSPEQRITPEKALKHKFFIKNGLSEKKNPLKSNKNHIKKR